MCVSFILYYPKMDLDQCLGFPVYNHIARTTFAISSIVKSWDFRKASVREKFQNELTESDYWTVCKLSDNLVSYIHSDEGQNELPIFNCSQTNKYKKLVVCYSRLNAFLLINQFIYFIFDFPMMPFGWEWAVRYTVGIIPLSKGGAVYTWHYLIFMVL